MVITPNLFAIGFLFIPNQRQQSVKSGFKALLYNKLGDIVLFLAVATGFELTKTSDLVLSITLIH
jgi:NADH-quinone oxidoreductase subunit L